MSSMEPDAKEFLKKIVRTLFTGILWLTLNMTMGIYFGLLFIEERISLGNVLFYIFLAGSLAALIRFYIHIWKDKFPHG